MFEVLGWSGFHGRGVHGLSSPWSGFMGSVHGLHGLHGFMDFHGGYGVHGEPQNDMSATRPKHMFSMKVHAQHILKTNIRG
jgi:hypothetical protein